MKILEICDFMGSGIGTPLEDYAEGLEENNSGGNAYGGHGDGGGSSDVYNGI